MKAEGGGGGKAGSSAGGGQGEDKQYTNPLSPSTSTGTY